MNTAIVITLAHQKGGVGKSTVAYNLATCLQAAGKSVVLIDTDVQGSLKRSPPDTIELLPLPEKISDVARLKCEIVIIDTPPYLSNKLPELFAVSDLVVVPTKAGYYDTLAIRSTLDLIANAKAQKPALKVGILLNMVKPRVKVTDKVRKILQGMEFPIFTTFLTDRVSYTEALLTDGVIHSGDAKAKEEITDLATELLTLFEK